MSENYTVSARKFRPRTFSEIVGQPHIVRTLTNALSKGRIGHAYLFSGTRGVGKTTSARILAKALNCAEGPTATPCLVCDNCKEIAAGSSVDVLEIDGASNTGIDNVREIRDNARFTPIKSRYKIYIIDEVHQISKAAFNALLKTLEEPPAHVVFIFATTELSKVPETILSRCQSFEYRSISHADIATQLAMIAEKEGTAVTPGAIALLARRARGSMRDAQSLFDQTAAYGGGSVDEEDVKLILGLVDRGLVLAALGGAVDGDRKRLMDAVDDINRSGADPTLFAEELAEAVREVMGAKVDPASLSVDEAEKEKLIAWGAALSYDEIGRWFDLLASTLDQMRRSHNPVINLEMGLMKLADRRPLVAVDELLDRVERATAHIERQVDPDAADAARSGEVKSATTHPSTVAKSVSAPAAAPSARLTPPRPVTHQVAPPVHPSKPAVVSPPVDDDDDRIDEAEFEIVETVAKTAPGDLVAAFKTAKPRLMGIFESAEVHLADDAVVVTVNTLYEREEIEGEKDTLEEIAGRHMGRRMRLVAKLSQKNRKTVASEAALRRQEEGEASLKGKVADTPIIQEAMEIFGAQIVDVRLNKKEGGG